MIERWTGREREREIGRERDAQRQMYRERN
jgi:hypothetical protein